MVTCDVTGGITLQTKLKIPIFTLNLPHNLQSRILVFQNLCIRDTVPKTYQNFHDKRLVKPGSKYPVWQRSQPISYKTKFSQSDNIYLLDLKYNITYQNICRKTAVRLFFMLWKAWKLRNNLHWWAFSKIVKFVLRKKVYQ